jgi:hypothetical protein
VTKKHKKRADLSPHREATALALDIITPTLDSARVANRKSWPEGERKWQSDKGFWQAIGLFPMVRDCQALLVAALVASTEAARWRTDAC